MYNGGHVPAYHPEETQSQDGRAQFVVDEEADDRADYDHGDSWHEDDDIYCEGDGDSDEDEGNAIDICGEPLFIDELTQRRKHKEEEEHLHGFIHTRSGQADLQLLDGD
ncbi:Serine/threonine-protein kinase mph1 [Hordeum vulgare]|nr:Serine/threonine-protein kinase mph1 [Hordeum vulgare]